MSKKPENSIKVNTLGTAHQISVLVGYVYFNYGLPENKLSNLLRQYFSLSPS